MAEIGLPWQFFPPPPDAHFQQDAFGAWYVKELAALSQSARGLCMTSPYNLGYVQGLEKAFALLMPHTCSNIGGNFSPQKMGYDPSWERLPHGYFYDLSYAWQKAKQSAGMMPTWNEFITALEAHMKSEEADRERREREHREYEHRHAVEPVGGP